jgi:putative endonuclease
MQNYNFYVYITMNPAKTVLYVGVTNDLKRRIQEHFNNRGTPKTFAGRYFCYNLVWFEHYTYVNEAIAREKEIKGWRRQKKDALIDLTNRERVTIIINNW